MYALHCRYVLYRYNKRCYGKFTLRQPLSLVLIVLSPATVAHVFIPGSTHPRHRSFLVYAGLPQTNEHKIISTNLLSPRPGWNRRWCYHGPAPITLCESHHSIVSTLTVPSGINPRATVASIKVLFQGVKASIQPHFARSHAQSLGILHS